MPGWQGSNRAAELPPNWPAIRLRILDRDGWACAHIRDDTGRRCRLPATQVDHITPHSEGGTDEDSNLEALCDWHHGKKSGAEGGRASGRARAAKNAATKPLHPGLLPAPIRPLEPQPDEEPPPF